MKLKMNSLIFFVILMSANGLEENGGHTNTTNSTSNLIRNKRYVAHINPMYRNIDFLKRDECPPTLGGERQFFCPTPNESDEWTCVMLNQLCNTKTNCPNGEDEDETMCLFHRPVIARLDDISIALENLHVLLSDQMNLYQKSINDREIEMSRKKILERLFFEHSSRYNSPTESPFLPITPPAMLPSPSNNPSTIFELDTPSNDLLVESLENEISSNANENDENFSTFDELPTRAQNILLQNSLGGRKFRVNSNPKHPFNNNNHESSSKISLVRRARNHPWNMMYF